MNNNDEILDFYAYDFLQLDKNASMAQVKRRCKELLLQYHPDKNKGSRYSSELFNQVKIIYDFVLRTRELSDAPEYKLEYTLDEIEQSLKDLKIINSRDIPPIQITTTQILVSNERTPNKSPYQYEPIEITKFVIPEQVNTTVLTTFENLHGDEKDYCPAPIRGLEIINNYTPENVDLEVAFARKKQELQETILPSSNVVFRLNNSENLMLTNLFS